MRLYSRRAARLCAAWTSCLHRAVAARAGSQSQLATASQDCEFLRWASAGAQKLGRDAHRQQLMSTGRLCQFGKSLSRPVLDSIEPQDMAGCPRWRRIPRSKPLWCAVQHLYRCSGPADPPSGAPPCARNPACRLPARRTPKCFFRPVVVRIFYVRSLGRCCYLGFGSHSCPQRGTTFLAGPALRSRSNSFSRSPWDHLETCENDVVNKNLLW